MDKTKVGLGLFATTIILYLFAWGAYLSSVTGKITVPPILLGMVTSLTSLVMLRGKATNKSVRYAKILNWVFLIVPSVVVIGFIVFVFVMLYSFSQSNWQF